MYLIFRDLGLLDTRVGLTIVFTLINLPIVVWMLYTFKEVPKDIPRPGGWTAPSRSRSCSTS